MRCFSLQGAFAGYENEEPEGSLEDGPNEQETSKPGLGMFGNAEATVEYTERCNEPQQEDAYADKDVRGNAGSDHGGSGGGGR